jgi:hypothetical protein
MPTKSGHCLATALVASVVGAGVAAGQGDGPNEGRMAEIVEEAKFRDVEYALKITSRKLDPSAPRGGRRGQVRGGAAGRPPGRSGPARGVNRADLSAEGPTRGGLGLRRLRALAFEVRPPVRKPARPCRSGRRGGRPRPSAPGGDSYRRTSTRGRSLLPRAPIFKPPAVLITLAPTKGFCPKCFSQNRLRLSKTLTILWPTSGNLCARADRSSRLARERRRRGRKRVQGLGTERKSN